MLPAVPAVAGGTNVKWMTERGEPVVGLTVSVPDPVAAPEVVEVVVVVVVALVGVEEVGGAAPARAGARRVRALRAAGQRPRANATACAGGRAGARIIGAAPRSAGTVHERAQRRPGPVHDGIAVGQQQTIEVQLQQAADRRRAGPSLVSRGSSMSQSGTKVSPSTPGQRTTPSAQASAWWPGMCSAVSSGQIAPTSWTTIPPGSSSPN